MVRIPTPAFLLLIPRLTPAPSAQYSSRTVERADSTIVGERQNERSDTPG
jgi:hypothetical protein